MKFFFLFFVLSMPATCFAEVSTEVLLARLWVNEAGFETSYWRDHAGICDVIRATGGGGEITSDAICTYAGRLCSERTDRRAYINNLNEAGEKPEGWPDTHLSWPDYREKWLFLIERAKRFKRWNPRPCIQPRRARHWGARGFRRDYWLSRGWIELTCPGARNSFWARPR